MSLVDEFVLRWGLNQAAMNALNELDPELQNMVIQDFVPRENTRDPSSLLISFCRSRTASAAKQGLIPSNPLANNEPRVDAEEFIIKWGLNADSQNVLLQLPTNIYNAVVTSFAPKGEARDIDNMFQAFAKSRVKSMNGGGGLAPVVGAQFQTRQDIAEFTQKWGLNTDSYAVLMQLPMAVLEGVITGFRPKGEARDINGMFQAFARSRLNNWTIAQQQGLPIPGQIPLPRAFAGFPNIIGQPQMTTQMMMPQISNRSGIQTNQAAAFMNINSAAKIQDFIRRRNLGETPMVLLEALANHFPQVADQIMLEFNPTDRSRDANETFVSFWIPKAIKAMSDRYGLKPEGCMQFKQLDPSIQAAVVKEFCPRDTSKVNDMNGLFGSFMNSRIRTAESQGIIAIKPMMPKMSAQNGGGGQADIMGLMGATTISTPAELNRKRPLDSVAGFIARWNLTPSCEDVMNMLTPSQQAEVIERFAPKHNTRDVEGLFKKFASSVQLKGM